MKALIYNIPQPKNIAIGKWRNVLNNLIDHHNLIGL